MIMMHNPYIPIDNRHIYLEEKFPVHIALFCSITGTEQVAWCRNNCEGFWNFSKYKQYYTFFVPTENKLYAVENTQENCWYLVNTPFQTKSKWLCTFHFQLESDRNEFVIYWKLAGVDFFIEAAG